LSGGIKLTRDYVNKIGKPLLHIFDTQSERIFNPDSRRLDIQALSNFLCSNKIEILNVPVLGNRRPDVYEWTLVVLHLFFNRTVSGAGFVETAGD
jgi:hypothetical protein